MNAYIYDADIYCEDCAADIRADIRQECKALGIKPDKETSDSWPQGPYDNGGGEADCPQHCGNCREFLENPLTAYGVEYVREQHRNNPSDITAQWCAYYDISDDDESENE